MPTPEASVSQSVVGGCFSEFGDQVSHRGDAAGPWSTADGSWLGIALLLHKEGLRKPSSVLARTQRGNRPTWLAR